MDKKTREELKESLKWIRWKKYRSKVELIEYKLGLSEVYITLRDNNKKIFKNVRITHRLSELLTVDEIINRYVSERFGYKGE